ncbi:MAG: DUF433 domain-containing protein [Chitinophagales bacterium]
MKTDVIQIDPEVLGGTSVFKDTRVPIQILFDHLDNGLTIEDFLISFPTVTHQQVRAVLDIAETILSSNHIVEWYESAAR